MSRTHIATFASMLLALTWISLSSGASAQERSDRRESSSQPQYQSSQSQSQQDSRGPQNQRSTSADDEEIEYRGMEHAALGVMLGEQAGRGVRIHDILRGSPADRAGLRSGDRIASIDDKPMRSYADVIRYINRVDPGQTSQITVNRDGDERTLRVRFATREELYGDEDQESRPGQQGAGRNDFEQQDRYSRQSNLQDQGGMQGDYNNQPPWARDQQQGNRGFQQLSSNRAVLGIDVEDQGDELVVRSVWSGSPADQAGLRTGDEIVAIDDQDVEGQRDLMRTLRDYQPGDRVKLLILRSGQQRILRPRLASQRDVAMQARQNQEGGRFPGNMRFQDNNRFQQDNTRYQENTRYQDNSARSDRDNYNFDRDNSAPRQQRQAQRDRSRYDEQYEER